MSQLRPAPKTITGFSSAGTELKRAPNYSWWNPNMTLDTHFFDDRAQFV
jgi:hypothetical protein